MPHPVLSGMQAELPIMQNACSNASMATRDSATVTLGQSTANVHQVFYALTLIVEST